MQFQHPFQHPFQYGLLEIFNIFLFKSDVISVENYFNISIGKINKPFMSIWASKFNNYIYIVFFNKAYSGLYMCAVPFSPLRNGQATWSNILADVSMCQNAHSDIKHTLQLSDGTFRRPSLTSNQWFRRSLQPQTAGPQKVVSANERSCFIIFMFRATQDPCAVDRQTIHSNHICTMDHTGLMLVHRTRKSTAAIYYV